MQREREREKERERERERVCSAAFRIASVSEVPQHSALLIGIDTGFSGNKIEAYTHAGFHTYIAEFIWKIPASEVSSPEPVSKNLFLNG